MGILPVVSAALCVSAAGAVAAASGHVNFLLFLLLPSARSSPALANGASAAAAVAVPALTANIPQTSVASGQAPDADGNPGCRACDSG